MMRSWLGASLCGVLLAGASARGAQDAPGFYVDEGKSKVTELKGGEFQNLFVKFPIPEAAKTAEYTVLRFYFCENWQQRAYKEFSREAFLSRFKDESEIRYRVLTSGAQKADLVTHNYYGEPAGGWTATDLSESFRSTEKDVTYEVTASVKLHKRTGFKEEYRETQKKWVSIPVYDEGRELWITKLAVSVKKLTGKRDKTGVFEVGIVDSKIQCFEMEEVCDDLTVRGFRFNLPTGKNRFDNEASWMGMRVFYVKEGDLAKKSEGKGPLDFVKEDMLAWLKGEHLEKVHWGYGDLVDANVGDAKWLDTEPWQKSGDWEILKVLRLPGKVAPRKNEDAPEERFDGDRMELLIAARYAKPHVIVFAASIIEDSYFGVPVETTRRRLQEVSKQTLQSVRILTK